MGPPLPVKNLKTNCTTKYPSRFESAVNRLQGIAELACTGLKDTTPGEDQYDAFSKHTASQLRKLPMRSFLMLQQKFQELITQERLAQLNQVQLVLSPANSNSNDDSNTLSNNT